MVTKNAADFFDASSMLGGKRCRISIELLIKIRHHPEDVAFAHDSINFAVGAGTLRRPTRGGGGINDPCHFSLF